MEVADNKAFMTNAMSEANCSSPVRGGPEIYGLMNGQRGISFGSLTVPLGVFKVVGLKIEVDMVPASTFDGSYSAHSYFEASFAHHFWRMYSYGVSCALSYDRFEIDSVHEDDSIFFELSPYALQWGLGFSRRFPISSSRGTHTVGLNTILAMDDIEGSPVYLKNIMADWFGSYNQDKLLIHGSLGRDIDKEKTLYGVGARYLPPSSEVGLRIHNDTLFVGAGWRPASLVNGSLGWEFQFGDKHVGGGLYVKFRFGTSYAGDYGRIPIGYVYDSNLKDIRRAYRRYRLACLFRNEERILKQCNRLLKSKFSYPREGLIALKRIETLMKLDLREAAKYYIEEYLDKKGDVDSKKSSIYRWKWPYDANYAQATDMSHFKSLLLQIYVQNNNPKAVDLYKDLNSIKHTYLKEIGKHSFYRAEIGRNYIDRSFEVLSDSIVSVNYHSMNRYSLQNMSDDSYVKFVDDGIHRWMFEKQRYHYRSIIYHYDSLAFFEKSKEFFSSYRDEKVFNIPNKELQKMYVEGRETYEELGIELTQINGKILTSFSRRRRREIFRQMRPYYRVVKAYRKAVKEEKLRILKESERKR